MCVYDFHVLVLLFVSIASLDKSCVNILRCDIICREHIFRMPLQPHRKRMFFTLDRFHDAITRVPRDEEWFDHFSVGLMVPAVDPEHIHACQLIHYCIVIDLNIMRSMLFWCFLWML